jgi:peptide deformylase
MTIKNTVQVGNLIIRKKSTKVKNPLSGSVKQVIKDLVDSMRSHELVGMAAPQIGKNVRIFVTEIRETKLRKGNTKKDIDFLRVFVNPVIISSSKKTVTGWEGCGSVATASIFGMVRRPVSVLIEAVDENGKKFRIKAERLLARVVQHEIDHLNGIVFTDKADTKTYMSKVEYLKKMKKK